jgi:hypothetical protein
MEAAPNIYWILTTSLIEANFETRKEQYTRGIMSVFAATEGLNVKVILVENNGKRSTFLDDFCDGERCQILYTDNNTLSTHYGVKELYDVNACIQHFGISDEDYVVKMTGRYFLNDTICPFVKELGNLTQTRYETILKYGWWECPSLTKVEDCILGLICIKAKYIKQIDTSYKVDHLEHRWARVTLAIPDEHVKAMDTLGIYISPGQLQHFFQV